LNHGAFVSLWSCLEKITLATIFVCLCRTKVIEKCMWRVCQNSWVELYISLKKFGIDFGNVILMAETRLEDYCLE